MLSKIANFVAALQLQTEGVLEQASSILEAAPIMPETIEVAKPTTIDDIMLNGDLIAGKKLASESFTQDKSHTGTISTAMNKKSAQYDKYSELKDRDTVIKPRQPKTSTYGSTWSEFFFGKQEEVTRFSTLKDNFFSR